MKTKFFLRLFLSLLMVAAVSINVLHAQEKDEKGSVSIPWDEFRKLLELDKDEILLSWEEFQKILEQTGKKYIPPYQLKDEKVLLTREQFKKLLDQMRPPVVTVVQPPADFLITKAAYRGRIGENNAQLRADFNTEIFDRQRNQYIKIPLFPMNIAIKDVFFDGTQAVVILDNRHHTLTTDVIGKHQIGVDFSLKTDFDSGPRALSFPIPITPITSLEIDIPFTGIEVEIPNAQQIELTERGSVTRVAALLSPTNAVNVKWRRRLPEAVKGPAKIYADTINHIAVEDDALRILSNISFSVLQNTIPQLFLRIPEGYSILNVQGSGLGDWREIKREAAAYLEIPFEYPKKGNFTITITAEKLLSQATMSIGFNGFMVEDAIREKGFLGVELKGTSEIAVSSVDGMDRVDVSELPASLINRSQKPLLFGFKYLRHPFSVIFDITKHEELPVISTVIDSASGVTLFTEDGKLVHRMVYKVRNTSKQFLELEIPENAEIWTVFVGGEPAKPRLNKRKILIPLNRSQQGATGLAAFDVELIYFMKAKRFGIFGHRESLFPVPDVIISQMLWSVYLPEGYNLLRFGGTVEKEKIAKGFRPLLGAKRRAQSYFRYDEPAPEAPGLDEDKRKKILHEAGELRREFSDNLALSEENIKSQMENEVTFSQRVQEVQNGKVAAVSGVLPIKIQIPTTGQLFRFAKTIVSEEPLTLDFSFASNAMMTFIKLMALVLILVIVYFLRKSIKNAFASGREKYQIKQTPLVLLVLGILSLSFSRTTAVVFFAAAAVAFLLLQFFRLRKIS